MQTLEYNNKKKEYDLPSLFKDNDVIPTTVEVGEDNETVVLKVGENSPLVLTISQARDLALALRIVANKVQKETRERQWVK